MSGIYRGEKEVIKLEKGFQYPFKSLIEISQNIAQGGRMPVSWAQPTKKQAIKMQNQQSEQNN